MIEEPMECMECGCQITEASAMRARVKGSPSDVPVFYLVCVGCFANLNGVIKEASDE